MLPSKLEYTAGTCPDVLKLAKAIPFHKSDLSTSKKTSGFRLISLLSVLSIVLEKIIKEQLITYFYSNNLMTNNQYGFRLDNKYI